MKNMNYSVLMSVYNGENHVFFDDALMSIYKQSLATNDLVLVCDGQLNNELYNVIAKYKKLFMNRMQVISYANNKGLGYALQLGLQACKNDIVIRADSDDVSNVERAKKQIDFVMKYELDISSSYVGLFESSLDSILGCRRIPIEEKKIITFSKRRCPFNHPSVIFRKSKVMECGGYKNLKFQEDYYLWYKMLKNKCKCRNTNEVLVYMRINTNTLNRRRNKEGYKNLNYLYKIMFKERYINFFVYVYNLSINFLRQHLPLKITNFITKKMWN